MRGLGIGLIEHRRRAVQPNHIPAIIGQHQRQCAGAAGQIQHAPTGNWVTFKQFAQILAEQHREPELPAAIVERRIVVIDHCVLRIHKPITAHIVP
jgi:hypothetical protein